ncbi:MAG: hypothetical protein ABJN26_19255 [Stappiaceae bacterium]
MKKQTTGSQKSTGGMVDYNQNSSAQKMMVASKADRIRSLVEQLGIVEPEMRMVDFGCGPGMSAIETVRPAIDAYRSLSDDAPIAVCHADQPGNDWNALFGLATGANGYIHAHNGIRIEAAIGSFYDQMVPDNSVALATCFAACHWLSHALRLDASETVWFADLEGEARDKMAALARQDWARFLHCRAREMRPGGFLVVSTLGAVSDPSECNGSAASGRGVYRALHVVTKSMSDEGLIDRDVADGFVFSLWFMTEEEARRPFETDPELASAFDIEDISVSRAGTNWSDVFAALVDEPLKYADAYTGYIRAFADSTLHTHLFSPSAKHESDVDSMASEFYRRLNALYRTDGAKYAFELWQLSVVLKRTRS